MKPMESMYEIEWDPRILIEASAGTGKTYTLTALYVRLLIEKKLDVDRILVMTFTKKATSELNERIFRRLKECLHALENGAESGDEFVNEFAGRISDRPEAVQRLKQAIQNFDDSQVFTIHGFCQKILKEEALLAGTPFDFEVVQQDVLLKQAVEDFWRNFMNRYGDTAAGRYYISKLLGIAGSPAELRDKLGLLFSKPYAEWEGEGMENPLEYLGRIIEIRNEMVELWKTEEENLSEILAACDVSRFQQHLQSRLKKLKAFIGDESFELDAPESLKYFTSGYLYDPDHLPKSGNPKPTVKHRFFEVCSEFEKLIQDIDKIKTTLIREAAGQISEIRSNLSMDSSAVTYNDLLINVQKALIDSDYGGELSKVLGQKYPAALVDEFQDTDPVQYSILNSIYPAENTDSSLLMIGDPKQAIYAFRGADVYTYLKAKKEAGVKIYTLYRNFRSTPTFNRAVNTLFGYTGRPFMEDGIEYFEVDSGKKDSDADFLMDGKPAGGVRFIAKTGIESSKPGAEEFVYSRTVDEILTLLKKAVDGEITIEGKNLEAGDVAVLVSSHKHAEEIKRRLKKAGVDSVTYSQEVVLESAEARRLEQLMAAVLDPYNRTAVNNALVSGFWGQNLNEIYELTVEGSKRQALIDELQQLNEIWLRDGFYPMFRKFLFTGYRISRLAQFSNSERLLTNLYQLVDICAKAEKEGRLDPHSLHSWLMDEMADPDKDEEKTLLLESDQNLVKISTVHNSKGLQFPVVFCPTLWDVKSNNNRDLLTEYHAGNGEPVIRFDQETHEQSQRAEELSRIEKTAEEVRKYYVAVTRAKYLCVIPWANHSDSLRSGLALSLIDAQSVKEVIKSKTKLKARTSFTDETVLELFKGLENRSEGSIRLEVEDAAEPVKESVRTKWKQTVNLQLASYNGRRSLDVQRRVESFSSLTSHGAEPGEPDYDQVMESYLAAVHQQKESAREQNIFTFPRGATAGTAVHKLFEDESFRFESAATDDHSGLIERILAQYRIHLKWMETAQAMIRNVVSAEIPGLTLPDVRERDQLREMEFHFSARQPSLKNIVNIIRANGNFPVPKNRTTSFLTGFVDLVIRQNGKYYILDYKSNHLGDSIEDYNSERLKEEIWNASYDVQYHLYTVALVKYLKTRLPGFDYEDDFGGVAYLFIRGMRKGGGSGVWFHKPDEGVIRRLANELGVQL